ncbi:DUF6599 family protein [Geomesophilobacter sediminis]|uniref:Uncharacterized protein n=1 Tax=Geomesophilobacter sediminis TaxID=2798584 RepID=A0A8J7LTI0_9BACT|nr:DUF6599 family protein [Geomesophilobacter sediminis]MBJ6723449.1 hypothetical protein [Geomesophilobacter sediminis]
MRILPNLLLLLLLMVPALAAAAGPTELLPVPECGPDWKLDGKTAAYDKENLSEHIDGEAELFFPYGFEFMACARFKKGTRSFDLEVYRMGSPLDAYGMFANYRPGEAAPISTGTEGAVSDAQLFFYQDRYFVRLQSTGNPDAGKSALSACAQAVAKRLPMGGEPPRELQLLAIPEVVAGSVRYSATSLLGYDFFPKGMMADALVEKEPARVFVLFCATPEAAAQALSAYRGYLRQNGIEPPVEEEEGAKELPLITLDPLYGRVLVQQAGRYLVGIARVKDASAGLPVLEKLRTKVLSNKQ